MISWLLWYESTKSEIIGGSRGRSGGRPPDPILSFSHTFSPKSARVGNRRSLNGVRAPKGKSWIRLWKYMVLYAIIWLYKLFYGQIFEGSALITEGDFDPKPEYHTQSDVNKGNLNSTRISFVS